MLRTTDKDPPRFLRSFEDENEDEIDIAKVPCPITWAVATSTCAVCLAVTSLVLLLDFAISRRPLLEIELTHPWWGHAPHGCWMGVRACGSRTDPDVQPTERLHVWQEPLGDASEEACLNQANQRWYDCVEQDGNGLVVATYRQSDASEVRPDSAKSDIELREDIVVKLTASPRLLRPGSGGWILSFCSHTTGFCSTLDAHAFCEDWDIVNAGHGDRWALRAGCQAVASGRWPQCEEGEAFAVCSVNHDDAEVLLDACDSSCPVFKHMHNLVVVTWLCLLLLCIITLWACIFGWARHMGIITVIIAVVTCGTLAVALALGLVNDLLSVAITHAAPLHKVREQRVVSGAKETFVALALLLLLPMIALSAAKNERIDKYRRSETREEAAALQKLRQASNSAREYAAQRWGRRRQSDDAHGEDVPIISRLPPPGPFEGGDFEAVLPRVDPNGCPEITDLPARFEGSQSEDEDAPTQWGMPVARRLELSSPEDAAAAAASIEHELAADSVEVSGITPITAGQQSPSSSSSQAVGPELVRILSISDIESELDTGEQQVGAFAIAPAENDSAN